jgi:hypothetical protein
MSAIGGKADILGNGLLCPLLTQSGHLFLEIKHKIDQSGGAGHWTVAEVLRMWVLMMAMSPLLPV